MKKITAIALSAVFLFLSAVSMGRKEQVTDISVNRDNNSVEIIEALESNVKEAVSAAESAETNESSPLSALGYVIVTDYIKTDGKTDVSDDIQNIIDSNPNKTIYFPDGVYVVDKPIVTPANPRKSVDLQLSNYAVIRASESWQGGAVISLGGKDAANDTHTVGSNYSLTGGVIDGSGKADGLSIDGGRETAVRNVSIKNVLVGLRIKYGANSGSSDADISNVNIIGTGATDSVGIYVEGFDNTFTNIRIGNVFTGVHLKSSANSLRNIHPLYYSDYTDYENSCGFFDEGGNNICIGFRTAENISSIYDNCFCFWYTGAGGREIAFKADGRFNSVVTNLRSDFRDDTENSALVVGEGSGGGVFENLLVNENSLSDKSHKIYMRGNLIFFLRNLFV